MELSKIYNYLLHDLVVGLSKNNLFLLSDYLEFGKQRMTIGWSFSYWVKVTGVILTDSVLGPLLFNIFINEVLV